MAFRRMTAGEPLNIRAADWNRLADMVEAPQRGDVGIERRNANARTYVVIANAGNAIIPAGTVVMLGEPLIDSDQDEYLVSPMFQAKVPYEDKPCALGVTLAPVNPQETGVAVVTGCVPVVCNVGSGDDTRIKPDGNGGCVTAKEGPIQLAYAPGTGTQWCYAILGGGGAGSSEGYRGYFRIHLDKEKQTGEDGTETEVQQVVVDGGYFFLNGVKRWCDGIKVAFAKDLDFSLSVGVSSASIVTGTAGHWGKETASYDLGRITTDGKVIQLCHSEPVLFLIGDCEDIEEAPQE